MPTLQLNQMANGNLTDYAKNKHVYNFCVIKK